MTCPPFLTIECFWLPKNAWGKGHELVIRTKGGGEKGRKGVGKKGKKGNKNKGKKRARRKKEKRMWEQNKKGKNTWRKQKMKENKTKMKVRNQTKIIWFLTLIFVLFCFVETK